MRFGAFVEAYYRYGTCSAIVFSMSELLDIVNENDEVTGQAERDEVHAKGLLFRLVYVCFYTPDKHIILQKRSLSKKNDPGKLTTTVSGHVGAGQSYLEAAIRETSEETGIQIDPTSLIHVGTLRADYSTEEYKSNAMRGLFACEFTGSVNDLTVEAEDGAGFYAFTIKDLEKQLTSHPEAFAKVLTDIADKRLLEYIKAL